MTKRPVAVDARGFTVVELLISMAIMVGITAVIFSLADPSHGTYRTQPEVSDMQQRLRIGTAFMTNDLIMAGAGSPAGGVSTGSLINYFAPIQPVRVGMLGSDTAAGTYYRDDAITIYYIPVNSPQTALTAPMPTPSSELDLDRVPNCPEGSAEPIGCSPNGFKEGMRVIVFDESGAYDDMTITEVQDGSGNPLEGTDGKLQHNKSLGGNSLSKQYGAGAQVAQIMQRTFYWNQQTLQLMNYDGNQRDEALIDNVVELEFEYFGDPRPPVYIITPDGTRLTNYGPKPPLLTQNAGAGFANGENCIFYVDPGSGRQIARPTMPDLAAGSQGLVPLTAAMLTDGPWCPNVAFPTRFDADLLRVRKVGVRLRVQVASAELRGPAAALAPGGTPLFLRPGTSRLGRNLVPDQDIRFEVTPRNFNLGR